MTDPRIEAAARALCDLQGYRPDGDEITPTNYPEMDVNWKVYEEEATVAIAAADAAAWRPIATAPTDSSEVLVWAGDFVFMAGRLGEYWWSDAECSIDNATHWQPLPAPPRSEVKA